VYRDWNKALSDPLPEDSEATDDATSQYDSDASAQEIEAPQDSNSKQLTTHGGGSEESDSQLLHGNRRLLRKQDKGKNRRLVTDSDSELGAMSDNSDALPASIFGDIPAKANSSSSNKPPELPPTRKRPRSPSAHLDQSDKKEYNKGVKRQRGKQFINFTLILIAHLA
jgi:hypothetical protein